jgi:hypothetical protein
VAIEQALSGTWVYGGGAAGTVYEKEDAVLVPVIEVVTVVAGMLDVGVGWVVGAVDAGMVLVGGVADVEEVDPVTLVLGFVAEVGSALLQAANRERVVTTAPPVVIPKRFRNCRLENLAPPGPSASVQFFRVSFSGIFPSYH